MADAKVWKVFSEGQIQANAEYTIVLEKLQRHFKVSPDKASSLLADDRVLIKSCGCEAEANKYLNALQSIGLLASIDSPPSPIALSITPIETDITPNFNVSAISSAIMTCPKCGTEQAKKAECASCGIIIVKYNEKLAQISTEQDEDNTPSSPTPFARLQSPPMMIASVIIIFLVTIFITASPQGSTIGSSALSQQQLERLKYARGLPSSSADEVRQLLANKDYTELEYELNNMLDALKHDIQWEYPIMKIFDQLSSEQGIQESYLNDWIDNTDSDLSYLARAYFYTNEGWISRGSKYAAETSSEQMAAFKNYHAEAYDDFMWVKSRGKALLPLYAGLVEISRSQQQLNARTILDEAIQHYPAGFSFRKQYAISLMPKWSGSQSQQEAFAQETEAYIPLNPRLSVILGYQAAELGRQAKNNKNMGRCIKRYNEALSYGVTALWLHKRAYCLMKDEQYEAAVANADLSLQLEHHQHVVQIRQYSAHKI